jgi:acid phosphatase (class A)
MTRLFPIAEQSNEMPARREDRGLRGHLACDWTQPGDRGTAGGAYHGGPSYYMGPADMLALCRLPPPPADGSVEQQRDLDAVRSARRERSAECTALVRADNAMSVSRFADALGDGFSLDEVPFTTHVLRHAFIDSDNAVAVLKREIDRPRPFMVDPAIETLVPQPPNASYPSGHSTFAHLTARLLAAAVPERAAALEARADEYARNRVIAGVHFPSDVQAGRQAAKAIHGALAIDPRFAADFAQVRTELRQSLGLP